MLVLARKKYESIIINGDIEIKIIGIKNGEVKIGISAPENVTIYREEIYKKILEENKRAAASSKDSIKIKKIKKNKK